MQYISGLVPHGKETFDDAEHICRAHIPATCGHMATFSPQQRIPSHADRWLQAGSAHDQSANGTLFVVGTAASLQAPATTARQLVSWAITNTQSLSGTVRDHRLTCRKNFYKVWWRHNFASSLLRAVWRACDSCSIALCPHAEHESPGRRGPWIRTCITVHVYHCQARK